METKVENGTKMHIIGEVGDVWLEVSSTYTQEWIALEALNLLGLGVGFFVFINLNKHWKACGLLFTFFAILLSSTVPFHKKFLFEDQLDSACRLMYGLQCLFAAQIHWLIVNMLKSDEKVHSILEKVALYFPFSAFAIICLCSYY